MYRDSFGKYLDENFFPLERISVEWRNSDCGVFWERLAMASGYLFRLPTAYREVSRVVASFEKFSGGKLIQPRPGNFWTMDGSGKLRKGSQTRAR